VLHVLWRFRARAEKVDEFRRVYAGDGDWARLFARAPGYRGTELLEDVDGPRTFVVIDRWESREAYERFRSEFSVEYVALDEACCELTEEETEIGRFWSPGAD